jgi:N-acetylglucosamine kinase-like BadF-type ATPase
MSSVASPILVGIDAGGTSMDIKSVDAASGMERSFLRPGVTVTRDGEAASAREVAEAIVEVAESAGEGRRFLVVIGMAGTDDTQVQIDLERRIISQLSSDPAKGESIPIDYLKILPDSQIALEAAFPGESGVIIIIGTGSIVLGRAEDGTQYRVGGWGYKIGDEGSGHAIGIAALQVVTDHLDGKPSVLGTRLLRFLGIESRSELIHKVYIDDWAVQGLAPEVMAAASEGVDDAANILVEQGTKLVSGLQRIETQSGGSIKKEVALIGGLAHYAVYRSILHEAMQRVAPGWNLTPDAPSPVEGALNVALSISKT